MSQIITEPHAKGEFGEPLPNTTPSSTMRYARKALKALASLQLTVVLFSFAIALVFFGTLAQLDFGIWTVVDKYFWSWYVMVPFDLINKFLNVFWKEAFPAGSAWGGSFPLPAGKLLGGLMLANLLAAHAIRFRLTWKRAGIFLIHGGLLLLFVGEFITREYAVEQRMTIDEGQKVNFAEDSRNVELAFINKSQPNADHVVVIPQQMLKQANSRISHPELPVDVEVNKFMVNATLEKPTPGATNPATAGFGKSMVLKEMPEVSGVDPNQKIDTPAAYVKLFKKGTDETLGTYAVSLRVYMMGGVEELEIDGKKYEMVMRFKRYYKPFSIHLDKFRFDRYIGTGKAKNYSSDVKLLDENGTVIRELRISMNDPLRHDGETFYQSSFDDKTETTTILQVVKNPGWVLPYISCAVVGFGLLLHFGIYLVRFLIRSRAIAPLAASPQAATSRAVRYFPWVVFSVMAIYLLSIFGRMTPERKPFDLDAFARLPVVDGGRVKPLDTVARVNLRIISGKEEFVDEKGDKQPAIRWYLEALASGRDRERGSVVKYKVFRIDNEQVLQELKLQPVEGLRYSLEEIGPKFDVIEARVRAGDKKIDAGKKLDTTETKFRELHKHLGLYLQLAQFGGGPQPDGPFLLLLPPQADTGQWESLQKLRTAATRESILTAMAVAQSKVTANQRLFNLTPIEERMLIKRSTGVEPEKLRPEQKTDALIDVVKFLKAEPRTINEQFRSEWLNTAFDLMTEAEANEIRALMRKDLATRLAVHPAAAIWDKIATAYRDNKPDEFNAAVKEYQTPTLSSKELANTRQEVVFNRFQPFYQCTGLYVIGFILSVVGFFMYVSEKPHWATALRKSATLILALTLAIHTSALLGRMSIMDRPLVFVTNLYSSAIFIGWGSVALCLVLERIFPIGIGNTVAAILGLATTIVAHNIGTQDTLEMMEAVLDTNFWLATHVTCMTLGYTATFVAGFLGAIYVLQMLGSVVRDSFESKGEPTVGALFAFGVAATGMVAIPLTFLAFVTIALDKFEVMHSILLWGTYSIVLAASVVYALALMLLRVSSEGVDAKGQPLQGQVPRIAKPLVALALTPESGKTLGQMIYGVVAFATLLSFVGTVLGGIWADQSWGRFWGWDPKENGAILIVLWNALILHARWAGLVKDRGVAVLAIFGNVLTAWSWFGTNQLGVGLHAYGFDTRLADGCFNFWLSQLVILGLGAAIPKQFWASATRRVQPTAAVAAQPAPSKKNAKRR